MPEINVKQVWEESRGRFVREGREKIHETPLSEWVKAGIDLTSDKSFWEELLRSSIEQLQEKVAGTENLR